MGQTPKWKQAVRDAEIAQSHAELFIHLLANVDPASRHNIWDHNARYDEATMLHRVLIWERRSGYMVHVSVRDNMRVVDNRTYGTNSWSTFAYGEASHVAQVMHDNARWDVERVIRENTYALDIAQ